jgi:hypothetical protein
LSVPAPRESRHGGGRWETVRYALDSNARTRLCLILLVTAISPVAAAVAAVLIHHVLLCEQSSRIEHEACGVPEVCLACELRRWPVGFQDGA